MRGTHIARTVTFALAFPGLYGVLRPRAFGVPPEATHPIEHPCATSLKDRPRPMYLILLKRLRSVEMEYSAEMYVPWKISPSFTLATALAEFHIAPIENSHS